MGQSNSNFTAGVLLVRTPKANCSQAIRASGSVAEGARFALLFGAPTPLLATLLPPHQSSENFATLIDAERTIPGGCPFILPASWDFQGIKYFL